MDVLDQLELTLNRHVRKWDAAVSVVEKEQRALAETKEKLDDAEQARTVAQGIAAQLQQQAHRRLAGTVTKCLAAVFDDPYEFVIKFEEKRGKTEAVLQFKRDGKVVDPLTASGGGVVDVAAFALRLSCLRLSRPPLRKLLILDEPFRFVSRDHRPAVREMIRTLAEEAGCQFIFVTHDPELCAGKVVEL